MADNERTFRRTSLAADIDNTTALSPHQVAKVKLGEALLVHVVDNRAERHEGRLVVPVPVDSVGDRLREAYSGRRGGSLPYVDHLTGLVEPRRLVKQALTVGILVGAFACQVVRTTVLEVGLDVEERAVAVARLGDWLGRGGGRSRGDSNGHRGGSGGSRHGIE